MIPESWIAELCPEIEGWQVDLLEEAFGKLQAERDATVNLLKAALEQMECVQKNLHKGMSRSIQKLQGYALLETIAELKAAIDAARGEK